MDPRYKMMALAASGPLVIWLIISAVFYSALWSAFIRRFEILGVSLFNLGLAVILSPGILAGGHGAIPFPGGAAFLIDVSSGRGGLIATCNFMMWLLTFAIFSVCGWILKRFETREKPAGLP